MTTDNKTYTHKMLAMFDTRTLIGATFHAAFYLAFAGFLRMREFTQSAVNQGEEFKHWHMTCVSIIFENNRLHAQLLASKTDLF